MLIKKAHICSRTTLTLRVCEPFKEDSSEKPHLKDMTHMLAVMKGLFINAGHASLCNESTRKLNEASG